MLRRVGSRSSRDARLREETPDTLIIEKPEFCVVMRVCLLRWNGALPICGLDLFRQLDRAAGIARDPQKKPRVSVRARSFRVFFRMKLPIREKRVRTFRDQPKTDFSVFQRRRARLPAHFFPERDMRGGDHLA
jgi:hypothetical protein